ncbi:hypothetical protein [Salinisphaera hydrothermalis]|uniref:Uncharacterized protein n=1 Tax=Salinisphaera hydrothermalis (strain C41B8) TaxID=1304275 RepID=A0A084ILQ0_SALHC|nr:hypothetical protein [Salinisphaera hydrothermalis]KEZ77634.1 hypothetical protein C41B8_08615 [Salinisphaera hydrothermalis C41B8]
MTAVAPESAVPSHSRASAIVACVLAGTAAALIVALAIPMGVAEAWGLDWLHGIGAPGVGWGDPFRHAIAGAAAANRAMAALATAAVLFKLVPAIGALLALRLPDILAAGAVTGLLAALAGSRAAGVFAALLFVLSPALWAAVTGSPGLIVDGAMLLALYAAVRVSDAHLAAGRLAVVVLALAVLIADGAGVYAIAVGVGAWLHTGLTRGYWRLFANLRLTVFAGLVIAGLTLIDVIALPSWARWAALFRQIELAIERSGLSLPDGLMVLALILPSVPALIETVRRPREAPGRLALVLLVGAVVLSTAATTSPLAAASLAPVGVLWWAAPLAGSQPRGRAFLWAGLYALLGLTISVSLLLTGRAEPVAHGSLLWASRVAAIVFLLLPVAVLTLAWRRARFAPAVGAALALASVMAAGALWLAGPQQLLSQRSYDHELVGELVPFRSRPIAVLAPVEAPLWRAELGRPVFVAHDLPTLCQWAARQTGKSAPLALVRPSATDPVLGLFSGARLLLQSAGTPRTSVMVVELGRGGRHDCRVGHAN